MSTVMIATSRGSAAQIEQSAVDALANSIRGQVLTQGDRGYDEARTVWNAMIDRHPGLIVRCTNSEDISAAVKFARIRGLLVAVRGGGHNIAGNGVCEGGMLIDLSPMKAVKVDPQFRTADAEPGVTLGEFDKATQEHGLATPLGINSTTGIAGLTLGGGFGWLSRKYGLTIDNLISAQIVTADGEILTASAKENSDLFWGIRGGGGNFGIVSSFRFGLHPVGPEVTSGLIIHPFSEAKDLLKFYRTFTTTLPDDVTVWVVMRKAPPLPFIPEDWHGKEVLVFAALCVGDMAAGEAALKPLRAYGTPIADVIGPHPYAGFQMAFDPLLTPGLRNYWKSHDFNELRDGFIDACVEAVNNLPSPHCEVFIGQMGGATSRVAADTTAFRDRSMKFVMNVHGRWETAAEDDRCIAWCRGIFDRTAQFSNGGAYVNFMTAEEGGRVREAYGPSYDKLVALKRKYDPTNLFCMNQNINPG